MEIIIVCIVAAELIVLVILTAYWVERRLERRITGLIQPQGGKLVAVSIHLKQHGRRVRSMRSARYIAITGEMRAATYELKPWLKLALIDDQPYQVVLRENYNESRREMLDKLVLIGEQQKLPGREAFHQIVLELARDPDKAVLLNESDLTTSSRWRFAPILQFLECSDILDDDAVPRMVEMVMNGKPVNVHWNVDGEAPNRTLTLWCEPPKS